MVTWEHQYKMKLCERQCQCQHKFIFCVLWWYVYAIIFLYIHLHFLGELHFMLNSRTNIGISAVLHVKFAVFLWNILYLFVSPFSILVPFFNHQTIKRLEMNKNVINCLFYSLGWKSFSTNIRCIRNSTDANWVKLSNIVIVSICRNNLFEAIRFQHALCMEIFNVGCDFTYHKDLLTRLWLQHH